MLSDQEKERIYLEEVYRGEVRNNLKDNAGRSQRENIWTFLNSALFLWFLSSVVIGLASFGFAHWEKQRDEDRKLWEKQQEQSRIRKSLDMEISTRLVYVHTLTYKDKVISSDPLLEALSVLAKPADSKFPVNVIPEYSNQNIRTLLSQLLDALPPDDSDRKRVQDAYDTSLLFQVEYTMITLNPPAVRSAKCENGEMLDRCGFYKAMVKDFNLDRWDHPFRPTHSDCYSTSNYKPKC
jgi:hypothetical protein